MTTDTSLSLLALVAFAALTITIVTARRRGASRRAAAALAWLAIATVVGGALPWAPAALERPFRAVALAALCFGVVRAAVETASFLARRWHAYFSTIFIDLLTVALYGVIVLGVAATVLEVQLTPLIATSAVVTAVIGLALQETLGNVFSGLSLQLQKAFEPGDWIRVDTHIGIVQGIGWRSTRLRTRSLELVDVPNGQLAKAVLVNFRQAAVGDELFVGIAHDVPPNRVKDVILGVLAQTPDIATDPPTQVWVVEYGDFAIRYRIRFWIIDYARQEVIRDSVMTRLWYAFRRHDIEIPYPIQTLRRAPPTSLAARAQRSAEARLAALREVDFLRDLEDSHLALVSESASQVVFGQDEIVCREGDPGDTLYVMLRGTVEVTAKTPRGGETHVADLTAPGFFGEMSVLTGEPRSATVRARTDTKLLVVSRDGFERLFRSHPNVAETVSRVLAERRTELHELLEQAAPPESVDRRSLRLLAKMQAILRF